MNYAFPIGGLPPQSQDPEAAGARFTTAYAYVPGSVQRDIVSTPLPGWDRTRAWIIARPLSGFAETFAQYAMEVLPGGGSEAPEPDAGAEEAILVAGGTGTARVPGLGEVALSAGRYLWLPPGCGWTLRATGEGPLTFHWIRKRWTPAPGLTPAAAFAARDQDTPVSWMPGTDVWGTTRFVDPADLRHDMHVNIVTFRPGGRIPFAETHVMEHGLYVLEGRARYLLNRDWIEVGPGDFMWLRAFCPQACVALGDTDFRYLLYKDVNRHPSLAPFQGA